MQVFVTDGPGLCPDRGRDRSGLDPDHPNAQHAQFIAIGIRKCLEGELGPGICPDKRGDQQPGYRTDHHHPARLALLEQWHYGLGQLEDTQDIGFENLPHIGFTLPGQGSALGHTGILNQHIEPAPVQEVAEVFDQCEVILHGSGYIKDHDVQPIRIEGSQGFCILLPTDCPDDQPTFLVENVERSTSDP